MKIKYCLAAIALTLSAVGVHAQAPQIAVERIETGYCYRQKQQQCSAAEINRLVFDNLAFTQYADNLILKDLDGLTAPSQSALKQWLISKTKAEAKSGKDSRMQFKSSVKLEGYTPAYMVLKKDYYEYLGGAHGNGYTSFYVLNRNGAPKKIMLADIVLPDQMPRLQAEQKQAWLEYPRKDKKMSNVEIGQILSNFPFQATGNWNFHPNGLIFFFQPYEIAPYALGRPKLVIPFERLQGVVKPEILQEAARYQSLSAVPKN
ncbi:MAG: RsiV family protein [Neisseria sp.]|uniref:RsiV family protein n=1 Tax=Neisseria sp. TaxID=192066 RepID=UPI0026DD08AD|nr:RsiV family protein [Neisseria sp.]MDO4641582.1 RsiV family protein [Neisseria sp.]